MVIEKNEVVIEKSEVVTQNSQAHYRQITTPFITFRMNGYPRRSRVQRGRAGATTLARLEPGPVAPLVAPPELSVLREVFPNKTPYYLLQTIKDHPGEPVDDLIAILVADEATSSSASASASPGTSPGANGTSTDFPLDVYKLWEVLPDWPLQRLHQEYIKTNDFTTTLLRLSDENHIKFVKELAGMCRQPEGVAEEYLERNGGDFVRAMIELVQSASAASASTGATTSSSARTQNPYESVSSEFTEKLKTCMSEEKAREAMEMILEGGYQQFTFGPGGASGASSSTSYSAAVRIKKAPVIKKSQMFTTIGRHALGPGPGPGPGPRQAGLGPQGPRPGPGPSGLDLHGLLVPQAMSQTSSALSDWWKTEQTARIQDGRLHQYGATARFVDPLKVVTGRGLHSEGGVSKIKKGVRGYLERNGYLYEEESWGYVVHGRRS